MSAFASPDQLHRWEFERNVEKLAVATPRPRIADTSRAVPAFGVDGAGIVYAMDPVLRSYLDVGFLQPAPCASSAFHVYHSGRRYLPVGLLLDIDLIGEEQAPGSDRIPRRTASSTS